MTLERLCRRIVVALIVLNLPASAHAQIDEVLNPVNMAAFDPDAPVMLRGEIAGVEEPRQEVSGSLADRLIHRNHLVLRIRLADGGASWIVAGPRPGHPLYDRLKQAVGMSVVVRGYQSRDRNCDPACRALGRDVTIDE